MAGAAYADTPAPVMAIGFENQENVKRFFGAAVQTMPALHGKGLGAARTGLKNPITGEQGTLMAWLKLEERNPGGAFQYRWIRLSDRQVGPSGSSNQPFWYGLDAQDKGQVLVELGDWHHWACVWNGVKCQLYVDGRLVLLGDLKKPFNGPPPIDLMLVEGATRWVIDDLKIYSQALTAEQVVAARVQADSGDIAPGETPAKAQAVGKTAPAPAPCPVAYDERQLVENPTFAPARHEFPANLIPPGWSVGKGAAAVKTDANGLSCRIAGDEPVSIMATVKRGLLVPGRIYQVGIYYRLKKDKGRALLRFRNELDQGTREFELQAGEWQRQFFYAAAPEDYDVGLYYLETFIEGEGADFGLRGLYCREATDAEVKSAKLAVQPSALKRSGLVTPDERWIEDLPADVTFMKNSDRKAAWADASEGTLIPENITGDGISFWFEHSPKDFWQRLNSLHGKGAAGALRLSVKQPATKGKELAVPGGYGMDPLPARSVHAAALLFGIGAVDSGLSSFQFKRLRDTLGEFGYFEEATAFLPFWGRKGFYKARYESRDNPADFREIYKGRADAPLFGHSAPGVLVSGYQNGKKLLLVLVNSTDQNLGKFGNLWVDHVRVFGLKPGNVAADMKNGIITATDLETGDVGGAAWNRSGGGHISDYWFNVAIEPGDYRLILVECRK
ncbi:MAG: LamG-like jellyroll fold domain-containing protein [Victivallales bacterium]